MRGRKPEKNRVHPRVLAPRELGMKAHSQLQDRGHRAVALDRSRRRLRRAGDDLQERRFARAVLADQAEGPARRQLEGDIRQSVERAVSRDAKDEFPQPVEGTLVEPVDLRNRIRPDREAVRQRPVPRCVTDRARTRIGGRGNRPAPSRHRRSTASASP